jgi:DNA-binding response OmpR family regulator
MSLPLHASRHPSLAVVPRILIADDDAGLRALVDDYLSQHGMRIVSAESTADLFGHLKGHPSLVVLDLHLGREDGFDLLRRIRGSSDVPVILVSAHLRDEIDRVIGLELGADDFLVKPFGLRELLARIRCILRRKTATTDPTRGRPGRVRFGPWELNHLTRQMHQDGAPPIGLTKGEYALLHAFLNAPQRPLSREHLLRATRVHEDVFDRSIDVQVLRLRRKLQSRPGAPEIIETVRGVGYVFRAEIESL